MKRDFVVKNAKLNCDKEERNYVWLTLERKTA